MRTTIEMLASSHTVTYVIDTPSFPSLISEALATVTCKSLHEDRYEGRRYQHLIGEVTTFEQQPRQGDNEL